MGGIPMARDHLWQRGRQWYLRLAIPRPLRRHFLSGTGNPLAKIVEPLGSDYEAAKLMAAHRVAACMSVFARLRAGVVMTPEQIKAALHEPNDPDPEKFDIGAYFRWRASPEAAKVDNERIARRFEEYAASKPWQLVRDVPDAAVGETISQALEAWITRRTRDPKYAPRATTLDGDRDRVRAFVDKYGDVPLTDITVAMASDFLDGLDVARRTRNNYARTLKAIFECARTRGRFTGENPFDGQRLDVDDNHYVRFTIEELQTIFAALPRQIKPAKHSPESALPWAALIAAFSGMRLEEIAQLSVADIRDADANGGKLTVVDIHNGGDNKLKNKASVRLVPMHSALVRAGLLDYVKALPKSGPLFPGLVRRASKGGKIGARLGELFRKKLVALDLKREGLCFHSFRHLVSNTLDKAEVRESDVARVLGHKVEGISLGTYSEEGPGLKVVAATVEKIAYEGLRL
jgi:integrase